MSSHTKKNFQQTANTLQKTRVIPMHRALRNYQLSKRSILFSSVLPIVFTLMAWPVLHFLSEIWFAYFSFWLEKLQITGSVSYHNYGNSLLSIPLPYIDAAPLWTPEAAMPYVSGLVILVLFAGFGIQGAYLPLRYLLFVAVFLETATILFFLSSPDSFQYDLKGHIEGLLLASTVLLLLVPWIHFITYYIFDFSVIQKAAVTLVTLVFLSIAVPFLIIAHVYLVQAGSLLIMPLLYFLFGIPVLIMCCVAIYGWAMSWKMVRER